MTHDQRVEAACNAYLDACKGPETTWRKLDALPEANRLLFLRCMSKALAAADAAAPQSQWRDIKDAPRDGTPIFVGWIGAGYHPHIGHCEDGVFGRLTDDCGFAPFPKPPTLFLPLSALPPLPSSPEGA